ncbi:hypothetical protein QFZ41_002261 [Luteibacter sp. W1I16]|uniref:hypothetical protein n=1 Tax=Luteibacter sp. W1I16 TaxID=3373922 RepID=UPI003D190976
MSYATGDADVVAETEVALVHSPATLLLVSGAVDAYIDQNLVTITSGRILAPRKLRFKPRSDRYAS